MTFADKIPPISLTFSTYNDIIHIVDVLAGMNESIDKENNSLLMLSHGARFGGDFGGVGNAEY